MLRPVGAAVEKAGGLPQLDIRLDNKGLDRKPSVEEKPRPPVSCDPPPAEDSDDLLELLCDDEEDLLLAAFTSTQAHSDHKPLDSLSFNSKFERLKKELLAGGGQNGNGEEDRVGSNEEMGKSGDKGGSKNGNGEPVYENTKELDSHRVYQNVPKAGDEDDELTNAPMFNVADQPGPETFDLKHNECYESMSTPTHPVPGNEGNAHTRKDLYDNLDDLSKCLNKESGRGPANGREYEDLDNVFVDSSNEEGHYYDNPDGGVLSQQAPAPESEQIELDEVLSFKNLPPLICTAHLGDEVAMKKLADTAASVLTQVVKHIHTSLGKWEGSGGRGGSILECCIVSKLFVDYSGNIFRVSINVALKCAAWLIFKDS